MYTPWMQDRGTGPPCDEREPWNRSFIWGKTGKGRRDDPVENRLALVRLEHFQDLPQTHWLRKSVGRA